MIEQWEVGGKPLMEAAGLQLAQQIELMNDVDTFILVCGGGNNGGDGYVVARWLHCWGKKVVCLDACSQEKSRTAENLWARRAATFAGVDICEDDLPDALVNKRAVVVDALLGSGTTRKIDHNSSLAQWVRRINEWRNTDARIVAIDSPTGMLFGRPFEKGALIVQADLTLAVGAPAPEHYVQPWHGFCGRITTVSLGFEFRMGGAGQWQLLDSCTSFDLGMLAKPHKAAVRRIMIVGGCGGMAGAARLAARGAFRAGAGLVYHLGAQKTATSTELDELITLPFDDVEDARVWLDKQAWQDEIVLLVGPGLGRDALARKWMMFVETLLKKFDNMRMVLDADGLVLAGVDWIRRFGDRVLCTPHPGEAAALLGCPVAKVQADRLWAVRELGAKTGTHVLLKGEDPLVLAAGCHDGYIASFEASALAIAGSGDVLSGICSALLARKGSDKQDSATALLLAMWWHQRAGEWMTSQRSEGWLASEIADSLGQVY